MQQRCFVGDYAGRVELLEQLVDRGSACWIEHFVKQAANSGPSFARERPEYVGGHSESITDQFADFISRELHRWMRGKNFDQAIRRRRAVGGTSHQAGHLLLHVRGCRIGNRDKAAAQQL